jgi:ubiquinone/menaquinone biosynthesis C-methylase UbiE
MFPVKKVQHRQTEGLTISFWSGLYDRCTTLIGFGKGFRRETIKLANTFSSPITCLDVGCGTGVLAIEAAKQLHPGSSIIGIDPEPAMLAVARKNLSTVHELHSSVIFRHGLIEKIPFPADYFDLVLCTMTTHHLSRKLKCMGFREIYRVLKPGGSFLNVDFGVASIHHAITFSSAIKLFLFLYFNFIETISSNFMMTIPDHFTSIMPFSLEKAGFLQVHYLESSFKHVLFLKARK